MSIPFRFSSCCVVTAIRADFGANGSITTCLAGLQTAGDIEPQWSPDHAAGKGAVDHYGRRVVRQAAIPTNPARFDIHVVGDGKMRSVRIGRRNRA